jgi:hypothetical protein
MYAINSEVRLSLSSALSALCDLLARQTANDVDGVVLSTLRVDDLKSDIGIESYGV